MGFRNMGSTPEDCVTVEEAAKLLSVNLRTLRKMISDGTLLPVFQGRKIRGGTYLRRIEVVALVDLRSQNVDLASVASMAMRALAVSKSNERRLNHLDDLLMLRTKTLETTESEVISRYIEAQDLVDQELSQLPADEVRRWANFFYAMDESYLRMIAHYTTTEEPWEPYMSLAQKFSERAPRSLFGMNKDLETAYGYLEAGRRHLRTIAYFYFRAKNGGATANAVFAEMDMSFDAEIARLLYP